jgi:hypothetical protein
VTRLPGLPEVLAIVRLKDEEIVGFVDTAPPFTLERDLLAIWAKLSPAARTQLLEAARALLEEDAGRKGG